MVPVLNELAEETQGKVSIAKLNVDEAKATAKLHEGILEVTLPMAETAKKRDIKVE